MATFSHGSCCSNTITRFSGFYSIRVRSCLAKIKDSQKAKRAHMRFVRKKLETEKNFRTWERESYGFLEVSQAILERNSDLGKMMGT